LKRPAISRLRRNPDSAESGRSLSASSGFPAFFAVVSIALLCNLVAAARLHCSGNPHPGGLLRLAQKLHLHARVSDYLYRTYDCIRLVRYEQHEYHACNRRVYFVETDWFEEIYVPEYRMRHGHPGKGKKRKHED
jgi:hypothetical protein